MNHHPCECCISKNDSKTAFLELHIQVFFEDEVTKFEQTRKGKNFQLFKAKMP